MQDVGEMYRNSLDEMERLLGARSVVGEPMSIDGNTIVPLLSIGFGFGAGGGTGTQPNNQEGTGGGTGAGGGVKPIALVVIDREGAVRLETIAPPSGIEKLGDAVVRMMETQSKTRGGSTGEP